MPMPRKGLDWCDAMPNRLMAAVSRKEIGDIWKEDARVEGNHRTSKCIPSDKFISLERMADRFRRCHILEDNPQGSLCRCSRGSLPESIGIGGSHPGCAPATPPGMRVRTGRREVEVKQDEASPVGRRRRYSARDLARHRCCATSDGCWPPPKSRYAGICCGRRCTYYPFGDGHAKN